VAIEPQSLSALQRLPIDNGGPVFAEPWQAQAFALAVTLSEQGHFTWKEWAAALAHELQAGASRGEPDDGSRYYEYWLAALERMVTTKGLADRTAIITRKEAWAEAYRTTPHGRPVELAKERPRLDARWLLLGLASAAAAYGLWQSSVQLFGGTKGGLAASAALGALLGLRHAFEPDHLAAISTLLTGERNVRRAAWLGVYWGIGHTLTLLVAGTLLVVLRTEMPPMVADVLAWAVVLMLVGFGFRALSGSQIPKGPTHSHSYGVRPGLAPVGPWTIARRPLIVGAVHGLAGSGALTALITATIPSMGSRVIYLLLFGAATTCGMAALSGLMGWPIARIGTHGVVARGVSVAVGSISIVLGLYWAYPLLGRLL
jgi:nitrile hydratase accessory protein